MQSAIIKLTEGNIKNHSIRIREIAHLFPSDTIGGSSKETMAKTFTITPAGGADVETDIAGDKMIFRRRAWIGEMIRRYQLQPDDEIVIQRIGEYRYLVRPHK